MEERIASGKNDAATDAVFAKIIEEVTKVVAAEVQKALEQYPVRVAEMPYFMKLQDGEGAAAIEELLPGDPTSDLEPIVFIDPYDDESRVLHARCAMKLAEAIHRVVILSIYESNGRKPIFKRALGISERWQKLLDIEGVSYTSLFASDEWKPELTGCQH